MDFSHFMNRLETDILLENDDKVNFVERGTFQLHQLSVEMLLKLVLDC